MIDPKKLEEIAKQVHNSLPPGIRSMGEEAEKKMRQVLQAQLGKLDLVSREEFDVQTKVLLRTREKLAALESKLAQLEQQLGTNPNLADSDGDGLSDLAELQGGSNPMDIASVLSTNTVSMMPALELTYLPGGAGQTQVFQAVNMAGDGAGWTNVGSSFISSNSWSYQLISIRDATQKYYRVIKP